MIDHVLDNGSKSLRFQFFHDAATSNGCRINYQSKE